jgi:hypothetical protein
MFFIHSKTLMTNKNENFWVFIICELKIERHSFKSHLKIIINGKINFDSKIEIKCYKTKIYDTNINIFQ